MNGLKKIFASKYIHLLLGLLALYGLSIAITHTSREEKIVRSLWYYCQCDYEMMDAEDKRQQANAFYLRERYREKLEKLTSDIFDYRNKEQMQAFFMRQGLVYDVWRTGKGFHSYLLAKLAGSGTYEAQIPEKVKFEYCILGEKKISSFEEFCYGEWATYLVSTGEEKVYIHRDVLDSLLERYFDCLWEREVQSSEEFHRDLHADPLYRDLKPICEDVFVKRLYRTKKLSKKYFMEQAFDVFFPTMLLMGARLVADKDDELPPGERYERAFLTGLSLRPTFTMLELCHDNPRLRKISKDLPRNSDLPEEDPIALGQISQAAQRILDRMNRASKKSRKP